MLQLLTTDHNDLLLVDWQIMMDDTKGVLIDEFLEITESVATVKQSVMD